jgi:hypothetical protein
MICPNEAINVISSLDTNAKWHDIGTKNNFLILKCTIRTFDRAICYEIEVQTIIDLR